MQGSARRDISRPRVPLQGPRARLASNNVVRVQARSASTTQENVQVNPSTSVANRIRGFRGFQRVERARARGCGGRRSRPAQRAEAKRTPEQPRSRSCREAPLRFEWTHVSPATPWFPILAIERTLSDPTGCPGPRRCRSRVGYAVARSLGWAPRPYPRNTHRLVDSSNGPPLSCWSRCNRGSPPSR